MKTHHIIYSLLALSLTLSSCKKFLDIKRGDDKAYVTTVDDCQKLLDNYEKMNTGYPYDGEISADNYFILDATFNATGTRILPVEKNFYYWVPTAQRLTGEQNWLNTYQTVYTANLVLENLEKIRKEGGNESAVNPVKGAALFYRAFAFWQIAQLYTKPYSAATAGQDPGIPLRLSPDMNDKSSRGTVQETYDRIVQDLSDAINLLPNTSSISSRPNKVAAYAMLARVYLTMQDYPNALINSNSALLLKNTLLDYNNLSKTSSTPFTRFNNAEVIFHAVCARSNILEPGIIASLSIAKIDRTLAASYVANDLRSKIFLKANSGPLHIGTFRFTGNYEPTTSSTFFIGLAVDELYLIQAECYARAGNTEAAMKSLNDLLVKRWSTGTYTNMSATTPEGALSKILEERRKELLMRGLRWSDLRRLNTADIVRRVDGNGAIAATLPANSLLYVLLIPADVINVGHIPQNAR